MKELLNKRTFTQKQYDLGGADRRMEAHIGHIHYRDGALKNGAFQDCDTTLSYNNGSKLWSMTKASYEAEVGLYGDITFNNVNHSIQFIVDNPSRIEGIPYGGSVFGQQGKGLIWPNIFGTGGHQIVEVRNGSLTKVFRFESKPSTNVITFQVVFSGNIKLLLEGVELKPLLQEVRTTGILNIECLGRLTWLRKPSAWNHRGERSDIQLRWYRSGAKLYIDKIIPQSFIDDTFNESGAWLECDTTTSYYGGTGDGAVRQNDTTPNWSVCRAQAGGLAYTGTAYENLDSSNYTTLYELKRLFYPIDTSKIPSDATIQSADLWIGWHFYKVDNSPPFSSLCLVQSTQADPTALSGNDFSAIVLNNPDEGTTRRSWNDIQANGPNASEDASKKYPLNSKGLSWISKTGYTKFAIRTSDDVDNNLRSQTSDNYVRMAMAEETGTALDPYLDVNYIEFFPGVSVANGTLRHISSRGA